jgi:hypothetical protein
VVVGHGVAIGRDEEARTLSRHDVTFRPALIVGCIFTVGHSEVVKKSLHVRVGWKRPIAVRAHHFGAGVHFDAHRYDGRFDLLD